VVQPFDAFTSGAIYKTGDGGLTWIKTGPVTSNQFDFEVVDIGIDSQNSDVIWAVTNSSGLGEYYDGTLDRSEDGEYMMINPSGIVPITAIADGHANKTIRNKTVLGGDVTWTDIAMQSGVPGLYFNPNSSNSSSSSGYG